MLFRSNNSVSIKATNPYGSDEDHVQIIYRRVASDSGSVGTPPKVNITSPSVNPYTTTESTISVMAKVENVNSKSQIEVKVMVATQMISPTTMLQKRYSLLQA